LLAGINTYSTTEEFFEEIEEIEEICRRLKRSGRLKRSAAEAAEEADTPHTTSPPPQSAKTSHNCFEHTHTAIYKQRS
jgi:S-methylmethionine-dependent homocysteine/selenocysteine methylase